MLKNLKYAEKMMDQRVKKILIYSNGVSKILDIINKKCNYSVYATYSYNNHENEIQEDEFSKYYDYFDCVICAEVFEHFTDPFFNFQNVIKFLRPGGWLVGTTGSVEQYAKLFKNDPTYYLTKNPISGHSSFYTESSIEILSNKLGVINRTTIADVNGHDQRKWRIAFGLYTKKSNNLL